MKGLTIAGLIALVLGLLLWSECRDCGITYSAANKPEEP